MTTKWNLNGIICGTVLFSLAAHSWAGDKYHELAYIETTVIHGFSIGVTDACGLTNTPPDRHLCFTVWTTNKIWFTNDIGSLVFPTQPEYAYQVDLFDTGGVAVPKTKLGEKVGSKYLDFNSNPSPKRIKLQRIVPARKGELSTLLEIFRPSDLFKFDKPGNYTLRIHFQILAFQNTGPNRGDCTNYLIRFPPLDYPLLKSETAP